DEHDLDRGDVGLVSGHHLRHTVEQRLHPLGQRAVGGGLDAAGGDVVPVLPGHVDHAEAGDARARLNAEDAHQSPPAPESPWATVRVRLMRMTSASLSISGGKGRNGPACQAMSIAAASSASLPEDLAISTATTEPSAAISYDTRTRPYSCLP